MSGAPLLAVDRLSYGYPGRLVGHEVSLAVDTVARTVGSVELPLGILTAALGTPVFLWLLAFGRRPGWS